MEGGKVGNFLEINLDLMLLQVVNMSEDDWEPDLEGEEKPRSDDD